MRAVYAAEKCCGAKGCHLWGHMRGEEAAQQHANAETCAACMLNAISIVSCVRPGSGLMRLRPSKPVLIKKACARAPACGVLNSPSRDLNG